MNQRARPLRLRPLRNLSPAEKEIATSIARQMQIELRHRLVTLDDTMQKRPAPLKPYELPTLDSPEMKKIVKYFEKTIPGVTFSPHRIEMHGHDACHKFFIRIQAPHRAHMCDFRRYIANHHTGTLHENGFTDKDISVLASKKLNIDSLLFSIQHMQPRYILGNNQSRNLSYMPEPFHRLMDFFIMHQINTINTQNRLHNRKTINGTCLWLPFTHHPVVPLRPIETGTIFSNSRGGMRAPSDEAVTFCRFWRELNAA